MKFKDFRSLSGDMNEGLILKMYPENLSVQKKIYSKTKKQR